jgi:hypothetical protein
LAAGFEAKKNSKRAKCEISSIKELLIRGVVGIFPPVCWTLIFSLKLFRFLMMLLAPTPTPKFVQDHMVRCTVE